MLTKNSYKIGVCIIIGVLVLCLDGGAAEKEIPITKFSQNVGAPTITFLYWWVNSRCPRISVWTNNLFPIEHRFSYSCGYRKAFEEYGDILSEKYPQIIIEGANYDPPGINFYMSKVILAVKMLAILVIVSSYDIWGTLGQAVPRWYTWCAENKIYACMMIFFLGNMLESQVSVNRLVHGQTGHLKLNLINLWLFGFS